jgi:hypothetical protein
MVQADGHHLGRPAKSEAEMTQLAANDHRASILGRLSPYSDVNKVSDLFPPVFCQSFQI